MLILAGRTLSQRDIRFTDLTGLFSNANEALNTKDYCHVKQLGDELMAERIAAVIPADSPAAQDRAN